MVEGSHYLLEPKQYRFMWGPSEPVLRIRSGDSVSAPTADAGCLDCCGIPLSTDRRQSCEGTQLLESNPLVGPIWVDDSEPGDMLRIGIERIRLSRDYAWSRHYPRFGCLTGESALGELLLNEPVPDLSYHWHLDTSAGTGTLQLSRSRLREVRIRLHPFLGSIGVAPRFGRVEPALVPGEFGGNMDCVETCEGAVLYLPVWVRGAYLSFGDVHAAQGDGEICGVALETTADVTLRVELIKNRPASWPRIEDASHLMVIGSARPLMDAVRVAHVEMIKWLVSDYGFDSWEALQVLSQVGTMRIGNVVDPNFSVVAKFPKAHLPGCEPQP